MTDQNEKVLSPEEEEAAFNQLFNNDEEGPSPEPKDPPVETEQQPGAKAEEPAQQDEQQPKEEEEKVPRAALVQQRERRRQVEQQLQQANERIAQLANALASRQPQQVQQPQQQQVQQPEYPDENDPIAVNQWLLRREQERDMQMRREHERRQMTVHQENQRKQLEDNLVSYYEASKQDLMAEDPGYAEIEKQMVESRKAELRAFGFAEQEIPGIVYNDMLALVEQAAQRRQSPAMIIRQMAQLRGYARKPEPVQAPIDQTAKLKTVAEGQAAMKTMSGAGVGSAPKGGLGIEEVLAMTDKQFNEFLKKHGDEGFQKLQAGGRL